MIVVVKLTHRVTSVQCTILRPDSLLRLWRNINHLLACLLAYLLILTFFVAVMPSRAYTALQYSLHKSDQRSD